MNFAIDTFTVLRGCVIATGWTDGPAPRLRIAGVEPAGSTTRYARPDLVPHFGTRALNWGFRIAAATTADSVPVEGLVLHWPNGRTTTPAQVPLMPRPRMNEVLAAFRSRVSARGGRLLEIGARARSGNAYRDLFPAGIDYVGLDVKAGPNVDVVADAHHLSRAFDTPFDFVFSVSVFEHLLMPWKAALEMNAVMREGGLAYLQSHPTWPLHEEPWDFWRFSEGAWHGLFNAHTGFRVLDAGYDLPAMAVPTFALGGVATDLEHEATYLACACLVEKIGPARVAWDAEASEVFDLAYAHE